MANNIVRRDKAYPDRRLMHPQRDWFIGLLIFVIIMFTGSLFAGNMFVKYKNIKPETTNTLEKTVKYNYDIIREALELYRMKDLEHQQLRKNLPEISIPVQDKSSDVTEENSSPESNLFIEAELAW